jgi:hypothetical protein
MSHQLFSFEGRFITLAQIHRIKAEREAAKSVEEVVETPKKAKKEKIVVTKQALERGAELSDAEKVEIEKNAEDIDPATLSEEEVMIIDEKTGEEIVPETPVAEEVVEEAPVAKVKKAAKKETKKSKK